MGYDREGKVKTHISVEEFTEGMKVLSKVGVSVWFSAKTKGDNAKRNTNNMRDAPIFFIVE